MVSGTYPHFPPLYPLAIPLLSPSLPLLPLPHIIETLQANSADGTAVAYFDDIAFTLTKVPPINGPPLSVDASSPRTPIDPNIYGATIFWNDNVEEYP